MRTPALVAAFALLLVAGCGGSHQSQETGIDAALAQSPRSYLHYTAPIWWGRRASIHRESLAIDSEFALAKISAPLTHPGERRQSVLLAHDDQGWRVVGAVLGDATSLPCSDAAKRVLEHLAGGCSDVGAEGTIQPGGSIIGPKAERAPTRSELAGISAVASRVIFHGHDGCVTYLAAVSKVDPRYARVAYEFQNPSRNCSPGNGESVFERTSDGWKEVGGGSEPLPCQLFPAGVLRSLFGECWLTAR